MRKIVSKHKENKKAKRNQLLVGGILIFIITISTLGYSFRGGQGSNENKISYNGLNFIKEDNFWTVTIENLKFYFSFNPKETENINSGVSLNLNNYYSQPLYIFSENTEAEYEIYRNLDQVVLRRQYACLENSSYCEEGLPVKTCQDNFIIIEESPDISIQQQENCIFIKAPKEEIIRAADRFLFEIIGIQ